MTTMIRNKKNHTGQQYSRYEHPIDTLGYEKLNKFFKFISIGGSSHPWSVMRVVELIKWIELGEYDRIL